MNKISIETIKKTLTLLIPPFSHVNIMAFVGWRWIPLDLKNAIVTMILDGHEFSDTWAHNESRLRNLFFFSATFHEGNTYANTQSGLYLPAEILGNVTEEIRYIDNTPDYNFHHELRVEKIKFETSTEKLQARNKVEEDLKSIFDQFKAITSKFK